MKYLSSDIERLFQRQQESLVRKSYSCGIFQEYDAGEDETERSRSRTGTTKP